MPRQAQPKVDHTILEMALVGYQSQLDKLSAKMAEIRAQLGQRGPGRPKGATIGTHHAGPGKRALSAAARARMSAGQKKRWAAQKQPQVQPEKPKRKLSAAGRRAIQEATRRRWAAFHRAQRAAASKP
jgi:hypothetical protein